MSPLSSKLLPSACVLALLATLFGVHPRSVAQEALGSSSASTGTTSRPLTFERDIRPIFKQYCVHCHGEDDKRKGNLDVRLRRFLVEPHGKDGARALIPGKPAESELLSLVKEGEMPPKGKKPSAAEVLLIEKWIAEGALTARAEPDHVPDVSITEEEREFWAFQPLRKPVLPSPKNSPHPGNPIDKFIAETLESKSLAMNSEASKSTLLRRVAFDLTGLPPNPGDLAEFEADQAPDAYARMVDRFLASPHYGERWGRHWLDLAGYADSEGYSDADPIRPWAYHYRDYVIRSMNADKPLDLFIREQIAGDEMVTGALKNMSPDTVDKLAATGFLRMVPDGTAAAAKSDQLTARNDVVAETLKVVSTSLMGLTVGCAQCHDHKLDPIPQQDYYRLRAVFEPGFDTANWRVPNARLVSLMTEAERSRSNAIETEAKRIDERRKKREDELIDLVLGWELEKAPEEARESLKIAYKTPPKERSAEQLKQLDKHPSIRNLSPGSLYLYDDKYKTKHKAELQKIADEAASFRKTKPTEIMLPVFNETPAAAKSPPATHVFHRGDPQSPKALIQPGGLSVLASAQPISFVPSSPLPSSSGRRTEFVRHLTSGNHPLLGRVLVNRIWHHHFGRGLVSTPSDFGSIGDRPSHPDLLDWLALELVERNWSLKSLHRLILNSAVYKQSSTRSSEKETIDPDNRLLSRANLRRVDAESLRDSMLKVSGTLNPKMFGTPVPVMLDFDGQVIIGVDTTLDGRPSGKVVPMNGEDFRRSVYVQMRRTQPLGMLETFDLPRMEPNCDARAASTVAPQSLTLMNNQFSLTQSRFFASRVAKEAGDDLHSRAYLAWKLALAREPEPDQISESVAFLTQQAKTLKAVQDPKSEAFHDPSLAALATLCQAILSSNAFLYVE